MAKHQGFTLIELMVSIALGLLVVAAGLSLYLASQRSMNLQNGLGELQQNAIFGLSQLTHDLRHVNLNTASTQRVNNKLSGSGIIFSTANLPTSLSGVNVNLLTKQAKDVGGTDLDSDQLTIQFIPPYVESTSTAGADTIDTTADDITTITSSTNMVDCEGNTLNRNVSGETATASELTASKPIIVQRYYIAEMKKGTASYSPKRYSLYCDAGYYNSGDTTITGLSTDPTTGGEQIIQNVDAFKVLLGVQNKSGQMRYVTIDDYLTSLMPNSVTTVADYVNVVSVNVAVLAHSSNPIGVDKNIDNDKEFNLFGNNANGAYGVVKLKATQKTDTKYIREVFSQVVAFRNTLGGAWE